MQSRLTLAFVILGYTVSLSQIAASQNVTYSKQWVAGVPAHVVTVNLNSPNVHVSAAISKRGIGTSEGFGSMLSRLQPTAAITGTYFCTRSLRPVGHIVVDGQLIVPGQVGTGICFTADNRVHFRPVSAIRDNGWTSYSSLVCAGPTLIRDGKISTSLTSEGFRDPRLWRKNPRCAIGLTKWNRLLLVTVNRPIFLSHMSRVMKALGAVDAINLDGGGSTALYWNGRVLSHPTRRLTNLIVVYESPEMFARIKPQLAPNLTVATSPTRKAQVTPTAVEVPVKDLAKLLNNPQIHWLEGSQIRNGSLLFANAQVPTDQTVKGLADDLSVMLPATPNCALDHFKHRKRTQWRLLDTLNISSV